MPIVPTCIILDLNVEMIQLLVSPKDTVRFDENLPSLVPVPSENGKSLGMGVARCYNHGNQFTKHERNSILKADP